MAPKKVIKSIIKSRSSEKTNQDDKALFESSFTTSAWVSAHSLIDFKECVRQLTLEEMSDMKEYLEHDRTTKDRKWLALAERLSPFKKMQLVQEKLNTSMDAFKNGIVENMEAVFGDADGNVQKNKLLEFLISTIAIESQRMQPA